MIQIKYSKSLNEIVALIGDKCISLKTCKSIAKPNDLIKVLPFVKSTVNSKWVEMPYNEATEYTKKYLSNKGESFPKYLLDIEPTIHIEYTYNEVNEPFFGLYANLPKYVLNGLADLISQQYHKNKNEQDFQKFLDKYEEVYVTAGDNCPIITLKEVRDSNEGRFWWVVECPNSISYVKIMTDDEENNGIKYIPVNKNTVDVIIPQILRFRRELDLKVSFNKIWKVSEIEDDQYTLSTSYFISEEESKQKASEIWHTYISRNVVGIVIKL